MLGCGVWWCMCAVGWACDGSRGRDTHTVLCVYVGVIASQGVCVLCGRGVLGGSVGRWGVERAAVMCRQGCGRVGGVVAGGAMVVVVPCVRCEWMRGSRKGGQWREAGRCEVCGWHDGCD
jgi:hypothetical protein